MAYNKKKIESSAGVFFKAYTRKTRKGYNSNDRQYDVKLERIIKKMDPEKLSKLMNDDSENAFK